MTTPRKRTPKRRSTSKKPTTGGQSLGPRDPQRDQSPARVRVTKPSDLLALVPYLLGFRPSESLVVLLIRDKQVLVTARLDLPPVELAGDMVNKFAALATQHNASGLMLFAYSQAPRPARALLEAVSQGLAPYGVLDALYVDDRRWWSLMCTEGCCPGEGTPYDPANHPLAAEAVYAGLSAASGRAAVRARISGPPATDVDLLNDLATQLSQETSQLGVRQRSSMMSVAVLDFLSEPRRLNDTDCLRLAILAADIAVRDVAWALMSREDVDDHLDLWGQVVARATAPWEVPPLCLLGVAGWISGNGALQNCCSERAQQIDPTCSMAALLDDISELALPPDFWDRMAPDMRAVVGPLAG